MTLYQGFFYSGAEFQLLNHDTIGYLGGASLCMWNLANGTKEYIMSQRRGFQCFATNHKRNIIALAEYGKKPAIILYQFPKQNQFKIEGLSKLEIIKMQISLDGKYLLVVNGIPENSIIIYDLEKREILKGGNNFIQINVTQQNPLLDVTFNPGNSNQFCTLFANSLKIYRIETNFQIQSNGQISQDYRIIKYNELNHPHLKLAVWDERNNLYICTENKIDFFNAVTMQVKQSIELQHKLRSVLLTQKHLIVFYSNGRIQLLNKYYDELVTQEEHLRPFYLDKYYKTHDQIKQALYNHHMNKIFIGHSNGRFTTINLQAEKNALQDEDEQKNEAENKQKQPRNKELLLETQTFGPYHTRAISMLKQLSSAPILVSAGMDGKIIFWSIIKKMIISCLDLDQQLACGDINRQENLLVVGTKRGTIMFYDITSAEKIRLVHQIKIYMNQSISQVKFSPYSDQLAVTSHSSKLVYFVLTNLSMKIQVLGYSILPYQINGIAWNTSNKSLISSDTPQLFVLLNFLIVTINPPQSRNHNKRGNAIRLESQMYARKIDLDNKQIDVLPSGQIIVTGKDKILRRYKQPEQFLSKIDLKVKIATNPPIEELDGHDLQTNSISNSSKQNVFASGGRDGTIFYRSSDNLSQIKAKIKAHSLKTNGVSIVLASNINKLIFSAGYDGSLFVWALDNINFNVGYIKKQNPALNLRQIQIKKDLEHYDKLFQKQYQESIKQQTEQKKKQQLAKIENLKNQLNNLLDQNDNHDELEQLKRQQFVIDIESRDKILEKGKQKCLQLREQSRKENIKKQIIARRIKQKTWDKMQIQLKAMNGLKTNFLVYNYQVRLRSPEEQRKINLILEIRRQNLKQVKLRKQKSIKQIIDVDFYKNRSIVLGGFPAVLVYNDYEKVQQKKQQKGKKKKQQQQQEKAVVKKQQIQTDQQWSLLYCAFELFSNNSKRNQIEMIRNIIFKIKTIFNKQFDKLMSFRQSQNQIINEKNKRISEIYQQLKRPVELVSFKKNILQNPEKILKVDASEIQFKRYLSKEEREKLQKERLKEEQRLRLLAQDDAAQRALSKMMSGTLEEKKQSALQVVIQREKWMDKPQQQMNEDEKMKLKEYQVKKIKAEEQKQRTIKKLEAQLRKLKLQIQDIIEKFDQRIFILFRRKLQYDYRIEELQLYSSKLAISIISVNEAQKKLKILSLQNELRKTRKQNLINNINSLKQYSGDIAKAKQSKRAGLEVKRAGQIQGRIKNIEKNVFEELINNTKKRRQLQNKWIKKDKNLEEIIIPLDPYLEIEERNLYSSKQKQFSTFLEQIKAIQQNYEGGEQILLNALQNRFNLRKQEAELEKKLKIANNFTQQLEKSLAKIKQEEENITKQIDSLKGFLQSSKSNIQVQFRLKQGIIQIPQDKPIPNLNEALLLPRNIIENRNAIIIQSADEKIQVMEKIRECKINVTQQTISLQKKQSLSKQLQTKIKEVQMLKVKKQMQVALSKKDMKMNETQIKNLTQQIENIKKETEKRIGVYEKKIQKINLDIEFIKKQNDQLEVQKWNLQNTVKQRQKIQQMKNGEDGANSQQSIQKFEQISINRKLFDKAKKQTQQIQLLRQELSKLKAKTFANFSNIQR